MEGFGGAEESTGVRIGIQSINIQFGNPIGPITVTVRNNGRQLKAQGYGEMLHWDCDFGPIELGWHDLLTIVMEGENGCPWEFHFNVQDLVRSAHSGVPARDRIHSFVSLVEVGLVLDSVTIVRNLQSIGDYLGMYQAYHEEAEIGLPDDITDEANHWMLAAKESDPMPPEFIRRNNTQVDPKSNQVFGYSPIPASTSTWRAPGVFRTSPIPASTSTIRRNNTQVDPKSNQVFRYSPIPASTSTRSAPGVFRTIPASTSKRSAPELPRTSPIPRVPPALTKSNPS
ncbi:hypothetical protein FRC06_007828, partial [Ceratobasidium sp. 370]